MPLVIRLTGAWDGRLADFVKCAARARPFPAPFAESETSSMPDAMAPMGIEQGVAWFNRNLKKVANVVAVMLGGIDGSSESSDLLGFCLLAGRRHLLLAGQARLYQ